MLFFTEHYGFQVFVNIDNFMKYTSLKNTKPALLLVAPFQAIQLMQNLKAKDLNDYIFCRDEFHNRSVEVDVLYSITKSIYPLILMSATPDPAFGKPNCAIEYIKKRCNPGKSFIETYCQTINILKRMKKNKKERGHILIFTSGNNFSKGLINKIIEQKDVPVLKMNRIPNETKENYMKRLDNEIQHNKKLIF